MSKQCSTWKSKNLHTQDQCEIKHRKQELRRKDKALAEATALLMPTKKIQAFWGKARDI